MPLAHIHLLALSPTLSLPTALQTLSTTTPPPLTLALPLRWIITPSLPIHQHPLLTTPWSILLITPNPHLPPSLTPHLTAHYHLTTGIPSRLLTSYHTSTNPTLLHPNPQTIPPLTGSLSSPRLASTSQTLEFSPQLSDWVDTFATTPYGKGAMSMLNLLAFKPEKSAHEAYKRYGAAFAADIGKRRGGTAKLVGNIVHPTSKDGRMEGKGKVATAAAATGPTDPKTEAKEWAGISRVGEDKKQRKDKASASAAMGPADPKTEAREWAGLARVGEESSGEQEEAEKWDEFALAHYPSILHFADMLASEDYQAVNLTERVPSLRDTCILCCSELAVEDLLQGKEVDVEGLREGLGRGGRGGEGGKGRGPKL